MAQILYSPNYDAENNELQLYISRERNTHEFEHAEAIAIAKRIANRGGRARVMLGGTVSDEYPEPGDSYGVFK